MVKVRISEDDLLDLLMQRMKYWTDDTRVLSLYENYLSNLINEGIFEDISLDIMLLVDNLYINDTQIMDEEDLKNNDIDVDDPEKVLAKDIDNDLYLVSAY